MTTKPSDMGTVVLKLDDIKLLADLVVERMAALANWTEAAVLRDDLDAARDLALLRSHLRDRVVASLNGVLRQAGVL